MLAAAAWLVDNKYTSAGKIILNGGSNGGFVVAAATNQAPKGLIGASVADVGVMDLLNVRAQPLCAALAPGRTSLTPLLDPARPPAVPPLERRPLLAQRLRRSGQA